MKLLFAKSPWEIYDDPLGRTLERIVAAGYDAIEIHLLARPEPAAEVKRLLRATGLPVIVQINSGGGTVEDQCRVLERNYEHGLFAEPVFFNCHTGRDHFCFDDNRRIFERAEGLAAKHDVGIRHESHRARAMFSVPATVQLLRAMPSLRMTADISHWFCVHESDLSDQESALAEVIGHVDHLHARVGFNEGPQVSDPRNPAHAAWLDRSVAIWQRILDAAKARGRSEFTITPEFGPAGYMPLAGRSAEPVADAWEVNGWMREYLKKTLDGTVS